MPPPKTTPERRKLVSTLMGLSQLHVIKSRFEELEMHAVARYLNCAIAEARTEADKLRKETGL